MKIKITGIRFVLIAFFLFICLFFPGDPYNLKLLFFFLLCASSIGAFVSVARVRRYSYILIMGIIFPAIIMVWSSVIGGNIYASISEAYCPFLILLTIVIVVYDIPYEKLLMKLLQWMVVATLLIIALDLIGIIDVNGNNFIRNSFYAYDMGIMGKSAAYAAYYKVFFKASPILLLLLPYCFERNKYGVAIATFVAIVFSGTRGNIFVGAVVFFFGFINVWSENKRKKTFRIIIGFFAIICVIVLIPKIIEIVVQLMNATGSIGSDLVRNGQLKSFIVLFSNPLKLILGEGFGTQFFDNGRRMYTTASEIAYFDLLRKIGLVWFSVFIIFVLKPLRFKLGLHNKVAYIGYLLVCFTNPLLFSSTAYVVYILFYSKYYEEMYSIKNEKNNKGK